MYTARYVDQHRLAHFHEAMVHATHWWKYDTLDDLTRQELQDRIKVILRYLEQHPDALQALLDHAAYASAHDDSITLPATMPDVADPSLTPEQFQALLERWTPLRAIVEMSQDHYPEVADCLCDALNFMESQLQHERRVPSFPCRYRKR